MLHLLLFFVANLTVPGEQEFTFLIFSSNFDQFFHIFPQFLPVVFLILVLRVGETPTREGPGYATDSRPFVLNGLSYGIVRLFDSFVLRRSLNEGTTFFLTVYVNGRDQQSIVTRQRVTHAIQSPLSGEWILPKNFIDQ